MSASSSSLAWSGSNEECLSTACACSKQRSRSPRPNAEAVLPCPRSLVPRLRRSCLLGVGWSRRRPSCRCPRSREAAHLPALALEMQRARALQQGKGGAPPPRAAAAAAATGNAATRVAGARPRASRAPARI